MMEQMIGARQSNGQGQLANAEQAELAQANVKTAQTTFEALHRALSELAGHSAANLSRLDALYGRAFGPFPNSSKDDEPPEPDSQGHIGAAGAMIKRLKRLLDLETAAISRIETII